MRLSVQCGLLLWLILVCSTGCAPAAISNPPEALSEKRIALSYDDAPRADSPVMSGPDRTSALLTQLRAAQTGPVVFFVTTQGFDRPDGRERVETYAGAGHLIANHSHTHMWASRTQAADYIADIDRAEARLEGFDNRRAWYRFPYLDEGGSNQDTAKRDSLRGALAERGLMNGYVTVDTYDWHLDRLWTQAVQAGQAVDRDALSKVYVQMVLDAAEHYDQLSQDALGHRPAQVLLLHENDLAAHFTADMVAGLRADGWTIIHPDEAFADPIAGQIPETLFSGMGRVSALAADAGLSGADVFDHWAVSEAGIEQRVTEAGVFGDADTDTSQD